MDLGDAHALAEHMKRHENHPNLACIECDRVLSTKKSLKQHMRTHVRIDSLSFAIHFVNSNASNEFQRPVRGHTNALTNNAVNDLRNHQH